MISFKQQMLVAGALREPQQFARTLARQRSFATQIGSKPKAPFGAIDGGGVSKGFPDLGGASIGAVRFCALVTPHDSQRRSQLQKQIQLAAHPFFRIRQGLGRLEARGEMRNCLLVS